MKTLALRIWVLVLLGGCQRNEVGRSESTLGEGVDDALEAQGVPLEVLDTPEPVLLTGAALAELGPDLQDDREVRVDHDWDGVPAPVDCDDDDAARSPRVIETFCDGHDQNCNGYDECDQDRDGVNDDRDLDPGDDRVGDGEPSDAVTVSD